MKTNYIIKSALVIIMTLLLYGIIPAQNNVQKAKEMMLKYEYVEAVKYFEKYFNLNPPSADNLRDISYCYIMMNDTKSAEKWLAKLMKKNDLKPSDILTYAKVLKSEGNYQKAIEFYQKYAAVSPSEKEDIEIAISSCNEAIYWINNPVYFDIVNLEKYNSENSDFGPVPFDNGIIITSDRKDKTLYSEKELYGWTGNPFLKLYQIKNSSDSTEIHPITQLNYQYHNGPAVYYPGEKIIYFTRTKTVKVNMKPDNPDPTSWLNPPIKEIYTNRLEIYSAKLIDGNWTSITPFEYNNADSYSVGHPALSPNGNVMYFVSDMTGGYGESDIYYCEKQIDGSWSKPINAGNTINSKGKDVFPFVDKDGRLYFSSDGHPGMGGLDLFSAIGNRNSWSDLSNLRYPINSSKDDFSINFTETGEKALFASNRDGGKGSDDIYSLQYSPPTQLILAVTTKEKLIDNSLVILPYINVHIHSQNTSEISNIVSDADGIVYQTVDCNSNYEIRGSSDQFFTQTKYVTTVCETKNDTMYVDLIFERIVINKAIVLKNIYYDFDKWNIRPDAALELDKLVEILIDNPKIVIELGSHTDSRGSDNYNEILSQKRAESAVAYIIERGIDSQRISAKGYGESVPINNCTNNIECSEEDHQLNRRTEFKVTSFTDNNISGQK